MEPEHNRHKLGHSLTHDLTVLRAKVTTDLFRVRDKVLARLEYMLDHNPAKVSFQNLSVAYGILTDKQLLMEQGPVSTTNNTVIINGLSRKDALSFLKGGQEGDDFTSQKRYSELNISGYVDRSGKLTPKPDSNMETVQNNASILDNTAPIQR